MEEVKSVTGIKSVDFKIKAVGHGVVNWNGSTKVKMWDVKNSKYRDVDNHNMPKLRGYSNIKGKWDDGNPQYKQANEVDFEKTPLYISNNCIRHHLFKAQSFDLLDSNIDNIVKNPDKLLCSLTGLVRGYVVTSKEWKKTSALLLTDFVEQLGNGNFEQMGRSGPKKENESKSDKDNTIFSKTTFGDTEYVAYASISIEQLQFIPLNNNLGRQAMYLNEDTDEGVELAQKLTEFLHAFEGCSNAAEAVYHKNYVRVGSIYHYGEAGILLNDEAINILVQQTKSLLENLTIRQAKGYMYVDQVEVDYNDGSSGRDMMRLKSGNSSPNPDKKSKYAIYFKEVDKGAN